MTDFEEKDDWSSLALQPDENETGYLQTDEFQDVFTSLELVENLLRSVTENRVHWKWVILATHSALQGACVCILTRTDGGGALTKQSEKAHLERIQSDWAGTEPPADRLEPLPGLLKRLPGNLKTIISKTPLSEAAPALESDLFRLHSFRNRFTHFPSTNWSIQTAGLPRIILNAVTLIELIVLSQHYQRYNKFNDLKNSQEMLGQIKSILDEML